MNQTSPIWVAVAAVVAFFSSPSLAQPYSSYQPYNAPAPLKPWVDWIQHDLKNRNCPLSSGTSRQCLFPGELDLDITKGTGFFTAQFKVHKGMYAILPGEEEVWPTDVKLNSSPAVVIEQQNRPVLWLTPGEHKVTGTLKFSKPPESLAIDPATALITASLNGVELEDLSISPNGRLLFKSENNQTSEDQQDQVILKVFRRLTDSVPSVLDTEVTMTVTGASRVVKIGPISPTGFRRSSAGGDLQVRWNEDDFAEIRVKPGQYRLYLKSISTAPLESVSRPAASAPWPDEEVWVFQSQDSVRRVSVENVTSIDPEQTSLPSYWRSLPAYLMSPSDSMTITQKKRGDENPAPDTLKLSRDVWLDFNGDAFTVQDKISGSVSRSWRLSMQQPATLGRVAVDGQNQLITKLEGEKEQGVEIRQGSINMVADSRIPNSGVFPAAGWNTGFEDVRGTLHLPPGYRLFGAFGTDFSWGSWIKTWDLMHIFLVLIVTFAFAKIRSLVAGFVAFGGLILLIPESGSPQYIWLVFIPLLALMKVVKSDTPRKVVRVCHFGFSTILILVSLVFALGQIRQLMYPSLELPYQSIDGHSTGEDFFGMLNDGFTGGLPEEPAMAPSDMGVRGLNEDIEGEEYDSSIASQEMTRNVPLKSKGKWDKKIMQNVYQEYDKNAVVQTGPGLPNWKWRSASFGWSGPVQPDQSATFVLMGPVVNGLLTVLRLLLLGGLIFFALNLRNIKLPGGPSSDGSKGAAKNSTKAATTLFFLALAASLSSAPDLTAQTQQPSDSILKELKTRLSQNPECAPDCVVINRARITINNELIVLNLTVFADAFSTLTLPGDARYWMPEQILRNGVNVRGARRNTSDKISVQVPPGRHEFVLRGHTKKRRVVQIPWTQVPRTAVVSLDGWTLDGVNDDGRIDSTWIIQRQKKAESQGGADEDFSQSAIKPFGKVERTLRIGLDWKIETKVTRPFASYGSALFSVPLLKGENVTSAGIDIKGNVARLPFGETTSEISWVSTLKKTDAINLKASDSQEFMEVWIVEISPIWHGKFSGIPWIFQDRASATNQTFYPWPGEELTISVIRPTSVPGANLTIDSAHYKVTPGQRSTGSTLDLSIRASRGGEHEIKLPEKADVKSMSIDGKSFSGRTQDESGKLVLPIRPGKQTINISWNDPNGLATRYVTPAIDLRNPVVNSKVDMIASGRWVLAMGGPKVGPAILFWSQVALIFFVSLVLGRLNLTPVRSWQWFFLGLGMTQVSLVTAVIVIGFFLAIGAKKKWGLQPKDKVSSGLFNLGQLGLAFWAFVAAVCYIVALRQGFFGQPEMQITGNGSGYGTLKWFVDRTDGPLPTPWMISVPLLAYQITMLVWALWLAFSLVSWSRWIWDAFGTGGFWKKMEGLKSPLKSGNASGTQQVDDLWGGGNNDGGDKK